MVKYYSLTVPSWILADIVNGAFPVFY